jgi:hypothetical protein
MEKYQKIPPKHFFPFIFIKIHAAVPLTKKVANSKCPHRAAKHSMTSASIANFVVAIYAITKGWRRPVCVTLFNRHLKIKHLERTAARKAYNKSH